MKVCRGCPFLELVENREQPHSCSVSIQVAIEKLLTAKAAQNLRPKYLTSLRQYLALFSRGRESMPLSSISLETVENWFISRKEAPASQNSNAGRLGSLFAFAVKRGWMKENPCEKLDRVSVDRKIPVILTLEQTQLLILNCPQHLKPYLALALFAGIRPDEILRMTWQDVNFQTGSAYVDGKTRQRRIVPLNPLTVESLRKYPEQTGRIAPSKSTLRRWQKKMRGMLGGKWTQDILRHTAASYLLAKHGDAGKVATMLGNSPQILLTHYNNPVAACECEKFWQLTC